MIMLCLTVPDVMPRILIAMTAVPKRSADTGGRLPWEKPAVGGDNSRLRIASMGT